MVAVAWPFVSPSAERPSPAVASDDRRRIDAAWRRRDAAYAGLRDLEQDHRTGKVTDEDYQAERRRLRARGRRGCCGSWIARLDRGDRPDPPREV